MIITGYHKMIILIHISVHAYIVHVYAAAKIPFVNAYHTGPASGAVQQPQASIAVQPPHQQTWTFSVNLNYEQLSMWLSNHPQFVGADYQQDISKLKGNNAMSFEVI